jgi:hypothetical protein
MPKYFFHLTGDPAHDLLGHECANDKEAKDHENYERGDEIFQVPLACTTV